MTDAAKNPTNRNNTCPQCHSPLRWRQVLSPTQCYYCGTKLRLKRTLNKSEKQFLATLYIFQLVWVLAIQVFPALKNFAFFTISLLLVVATTALVTKTNPLTRSKVEVFAIPNEHPKPSFARHRTGLFVGLALIISVTLYLLLIWLGLSYT